jgi:SAM-dependent methyltransferase
MNGYEQGYLYDPAWADERTRLSSLAALFDAVTMRHLAAVGVQAGWRCWEIGAGTGTIAKRLAAICGPSGHVVATDLDVRFLHDLDDGLEDDLDDESDGNGRNGANRVDVPGGVDGLRGLDGGGGPDGLDGRGGAPDGLDGRGGPDGVDGRSGSSRVEVVRHDVSDPPPHVEAFDLVHARAVLAHVPRRDDAVPRLVDALRPGGVLLLEDVVFGEATTEALAVATRPREYAATMTLAARAVAGAFRTVAADPEYGLRLPDVLAAAGLRDVGAELTHRLVHGGSREAVFFALTMRELGPRLVDAGLLTEEDASLAADLAEDPASSWFSMGLVSAWGRRP